MRRDGIDFRRLLLTTSMLVAYVNTGSAQILFGSVGTELDDDGGYIVFGAIGGNIAEPTTWDLAASRADTVTDLDDLSTTSFDGSVYHDFGRLGLRFGFGSWQDDEFVSVQQLSAAIDLHGTGWSLALETRHGENDFEPFDIDRTITRRDGSLLTITATAHCKVDDTGIGARLRFSNDDWAFTFDGMTFGYDNYACEFGVPALDILRTSTRDEFVQFADRLTDVLSLGSGRRLLARTSLLESRFGVGLSRETARRSYGVNFDRIEDAFFGRVADTLSGSISFVLRSGNEIQLYVGATDSDGRDTIAFLGLSLLVLR